MVKISNLEIIQEKLNKENIYNKEIIEKNNKEIKDLKLTNNMQANSVGNLANIIRSLMKKNFKLTNKLNYLNKSNLIKNNLRNKNTKQVTKSNPKDDKTKLNVFDKLTESITNSNTFANVNIFTNTSEDSIIIKKLKSMYLKSEMINPNSNIKIKNDIVNETKTRRNRRQKKGDFNKLVREFDFT